MSRRKTQKSPIRAERIEIIRKKEGLSKNKFAKLIDMDPSYLNKILHSQMITDETIGRINAVFPSYDIRWIRGDIDFANIDDMADFFTSSYENSKKHLATLNKALKLFSNEVGFDIQIKKKEIEGIPSEITPMEYTIVRNCDNMNVHLSSQEFFKVQQKIMDYLAFEFNHIINDANNLFYDYSTNRTYSLSQAKNTFDFSILD